MTPIQRGGNLGVKSVKMLYFLKIFLFTPGHGSDQLNVIIMITKEGSTKIVTFMSPGQGFFLWYGLAI